VSFRAPDAAREKKLRYYELSSVETLLRELTRTVAHLESTISQLKSRRAGLGGRDGDPLVIVSRDRRSWDHDNVYHWIDSGCRRGPYERSEMMLRSEAEADGRRLCSSRACQEAAGDGSL
jgi:hypothetical protein